MERENVCGVCNEPLFKKQLRILLTKSLYIECASRHEMFQTLDFLVRAGKLTSATGPRALLAASNRLAHDRRLEWARALFRKLIRLRRLRALVGDHAKHLRDHVAGALDR